MKRVTFYIQKYLAAGLLTIGGIFLLLFFSTQLQPLIENFQRRGELSERIGTSEEELAAIQRASGSQADAQLAIIDVALPGGKDATLIYSLVTTLAAKHAIDVESFSIDVGELLVTGEEDSTSHSSLVVGLEVASPSHVNTQQFIAELYRSLPISEVDSMRIVDGQGQLVLHFFYSQSQGDVRVSQISASQQELISELSNWTRP